MADADTTIFRFVVDSDFYRQSLRLREQVLRAPLGLTLSEADISGEESHWHFGAFEENRLLACLVVKQIDTTKARLRQMAVASEVQGRGLGRQLVQEAEVWLGENGYTHIELDARLVAEGFYRGLGYKSRGAPFMHLGIEHIRMQKVLSFD